MRICYITDASNLHAQRWIKYFADNGHDTYILSLSYENKNDCDINNYQLISDESKIYPIPRSNRLLRFVFPAAAFFFEAVRVKNLLKEIKPDLIHAHYVADYGIIAALTGYHPFILSAWGSDILVTPNKSRIFRSMIKYALDKSDAITCDGENLERAIISLGADSQKIELIYHGVDTTRFRPSARSRELREKLKLSGQSTVISMRHFFPVYNLRSLIEAIPVALNDSQDVKFIIASDGPEREELKNLATSLGVSDKIIFTGYLSWDELPEYLASSDIYVSTSLSEGGVAVSTMEAMASGLPLIVTDVGDNKEWVKDGINGFTIPINDARVLAEKITYTVKNKEIGKKFGEINRDLVVKKGDYYKQMKKMENIYMETIKRYTR